MIYPYWENGITSLHYSSRLDPVPKYRTQGHTVLSSSSLIVPLNNGPLYTCFSKTLGSSPRPTRPTAISERLPFEPLFTEKSLSATTLPRGPALGPRKSKMRKRRYSTSPAPHASRRSGDEASCLLNKNPCHNPGLGNRVQGTTCDLKALVPDAWRPWPTTIYFSIFLQSPYHIPLPTLYLHSQHPSTSLSLQAPIYFINQLGLKYRLRFISCITTFRTVHSSWNVILQISFTLSYSGVSFVSMNKLQYIWCKLFPPFN